jgi:hypothetical protein
MRPRLLLAPAILFATLFTSGQDWQHCQSDGAGSFQQVKDSVHSVTTMHGYSGWDEKSFSRFGDMTSVAVLQSLNDDEMTAPQTLKDVLSIIRFALPVPPVASSFPTIESPGSPCYCSKGCITTREDPPNWLSTTRRNSCCGRHRAPTSFRSW